LERKRRGEGNVLSILLLERSLGGEKKGRSYKRIKGIDRRRKKEDHRKTADNKKSGGFGFFS